MSLLSLRGVGRRYGLTGSWVLRGVDLDLPARGVVRVQGMNGSGKSTLLRLVAGVDRPTAGRVAGRPRTAYVPERFPVSLPFSATGYLVHLGRIHGLGRAVAEARAAEWLERFGAAGHARTAMSELSKGTSQKVAVAQALLAEPELLVLDEAWTGLDTGARAELDRAVAERVAAGGTVVFVDHDPARLAGVADEVYAVVDRALVRRPAEAAASGEGDGALMPRVRIVVVGPPGAAPPGGLPGAPAYEPRQDGTALLTAPAVHSDALLRALLSARPPWHIREVHPAHVPAEPVPGVPAPAVPAASADSTATSAATTTTTNPDLSATTTTDRSGTDTVNTRPLSP